MNESIGISTINKDAVIFVGEIAKSDFKIYKSKDSSHFYIVDKHEYIECIFESPLEIKFSEAGI